jgi:hypothetical protein
VLALWSPLALSRPWVRTECLIAKDRGVLVPVSIEPIDALNHVPAAFYGVQHIDLRDFHDSPDDETWRRVMRALGRVLKRSDLGKPTALPAPKPAPAPSRAAPTNPSGGGRLALIAGFALVIVGGAAVAVAVFDPLGWRAKPPTTVASPIVVASSGEPRPAGTSSTSPPLAANPTPTPIQTPVTASPEPTFTTLASATPPKPRKTVEQALAGVTCCAEPWTLRDLTNKAMKESSLALFEEAASKGDLRAAAVAGEARTRAPNYDIAKAMAWFDKACNGGEAWGCLGAGLELNSEGLGDKPNTVGKDNRRALAYYLKGCDLSLPLSCSFAAYITYRSEVGPKDPVKARSLYEKSCNAGSLFGCRGLAVMLDSNAAYGPSGDKDRADAKTYYQKGCALSDTYSCDMLKYK